MAYQAYTAYDTDRSIRIYMINKIIKPTNDMLPYSYLGLYNDEFDSIFHCK